MATFVDSSLEIARFCLDRGMIDAERYKKAELQSNESKRPIYDVLISFNYLNDSNVKETLANFLDLPVTDLSVIGDRLDIFLDAIPKHYVIDNRIIPFEVNKGEIKVAIAEPSALRSISSVRLITGKKIIAYVISPIEMEKVLEDMNSHAQETSRGTISKVKIKNKTSLQAKDSEQGLENLIELTKTKSSAGNSASDEQGGQIIMFVNAMIFDAVKKGASDIHIETYKDLATLRYRVDGVLHECVELKKFLFNNYSAITTRIKIMATLDISERRLPQDGAIVAELPDERDIDLRVSVLPTVFGERIVMRILDRGGISFDLEKLGFPEKEYRDVTQAFDSSQGMVLVTGPTGSGKSTTLYGALRRLNKPGINILTAEDPVEFTVEGVGQVQIREDIGLGFSQALRSFLRQDPEIILVGEIRDKETADISIKAALTGHLVLSTLHANDAVSTVVRLVNMGIPGYLIGAALTMVIAQRLARKICQACKVPDEGDHEAFLLELGFSPEHAKNARPFKGAGCPACNKTGYKGRQGIYEALKITDQLRAAIIDNQSASKLKEIAEASGFRRMQEIGRQMVLDGVLTIEEYHKNLVFN